MKGKSFQAVLFIKNELENCPFYINRLKKEAFKRKSTVIDYLFLRWYKFAFRGGRIAFGRESREHVAEGSFSCCGRGNKYPISSMVSYSSGLEHSNETCFFVWMGGSGNFTESESRAMIKIWNRCRHFMEVDLWRVELKSLPLEKRIVYGQLRLWSIAVREFISDKCTEKASALTYFTVLSIVPVIAMLFAIAKGFGLETILKNELAGYLSGQEEILNYVLPFAQNMLKGANGGVISIISLVFLIYAVLCLLSNIEHAFNDMWDVKQNRTWERKIADYVAVMLLGPILLILSSSLTVFVTGQIQTLATRFELMDELKSGIFFLIGLIPYTLVWLLLFLLYLIFPNTRVKFVPALIAGIIAGTLYQLTQWGFINFQFAFSRYNAIYGSLAFLPLFLIWSQVSWLIVLFGAEIAYAVQHIDTWDGGSEKLKISLRHKKKLILLLLYRIAMKFEKKEGAMRMSELNGSVNVSGKYVDELCLELEKAGLINKVACEELAYQPAFDIHKMDIHTILTRYESPGMGDFDDRKSEAFVAIEGSLKEIDAQWKSSRSNRLLIDLCRPDH